jgi:hypothetical protein
MSSYIFKKESLEHDLGMMDGLGFEGFIFKCTEPVVRWWCASGALLGSDYLLRMASSSSKLVASCKHASCTRSVKNRLKIDTIFGRKIIHRHSRNKRLIFRILFISLLDFQLITTTTASQVKKAERASVYLCVTPCLKCLLLNPRRTPSSSSQPATSYCFRPIRSSVKTIAKDHRIPADEPPPPLTSSIINLIIISIRLGIVGIP